MRAESCACGFCPTCIWNGRAAGTCRRGPLISGTIFLGAAGWTDFNPFRDQDPAMQAAGEEMNDYKKIRLRNYELRLRPAPTLAPRRSDVARNRGGVASAT